MPRPTPEQNPADGTLVVFGATGATGSEVVRLALAEGMAVRAAARSPDKLPTDLLGREGLDVMTVDVTDKAAVNRAVRGTTMIFAALGYKGRPERPILLPFVHEVVRAMREHGARRFVYQASAFNAEPGHPSPASVRWLLRPIIGSMIGVHPIWNEHDAVIRFLVEEASDLDWTVTRPGRLSDGQSKGVLAAHETPGGGVTYRDLAAFSLGAARTGEHSRSCPYLASPRG